MIPSQEMSMNGHETKGRMAERNLSISVDHLIEMRWMILLACGTELSAGVIAFDEGVEKLRVALQSVTQP